MGLVRIERNPFEDRQAHGQAQKIQLRDDQTLVSHACIPGSSGSSLCPGSPLALTPAASAQSLNLKAVIFEEVKPLYQKSGGSFEGFGVDVLEQVRIQARRRKVDYRVASSVQDGVNAVITGKSDIACGVAFTWGRATQLNYSIPFAIGGTRLLTASDTNVDGTPDSLKGQTVGGVRDSASAKVLKSVVPGATFKPFNTPAEALAAYDSGDIPILGGGTLWLAANSSPETSALLPFRP